jgi:hypothetical protein
VPLWGTSFASSHRLQMAFIDQQHFDIMQNECPAFHSRDHDSHDVFPSRKWNWTKCEHPYMSSFLLFVLGPLFSWKVNERKKLFLTIPQDQHCCHSMPHSIPMLGVYWCGHWPYGTNLVVLAFWSHCTSLRFW